MDILKEKLNRFDTDYRVEVIAASLIDEGINLEDLEIVRAGTSRRGFSKESIVSIQHMIYLIICV